MAKEKSAIRSEIPISYPPFSFGSLQYQSTILRIFGGGGRRERAEVQDSLPALDFRSAGGPQNSTDRKAVGENACEKNFRTQETRSRYPKFFPIFSDLPNDNNN